MPLVSSFYGILIYFYFQDHNPPHFHIKYNDYNAVMEIETLGIVSGQLPPKAFALVAEWAAIHREELRINWNLAVNNMAVNKIEPLI